MNTPSSWAAPRPVLSFDFREPTPLHSIRNSTILQMLGRKSKDFDWPMKCIIIIIVVEKKKQMELVSAQVGIGKTDLLDLPDQTDINVQSCFLLACFVKLTNHEHRMKSKLIFNQATIAGSYPISAVTPQIAAIMVDIILQVSHGLVNIRVTGTRK